METNGRTHTQETFKIHGILCQNLIFTKALLRNSLLSSNCLNNRREERKWYMHYE